ncbi:hypothetical protein JOF29_007177 [Kribbella aluminosa]|uniref:Secreted protein n=1 Tax=Kribbella aluminosa TaxID=416017 RepID=A0ABS4UWN5_9ACTN|nr:hypothetical protein [Kribbella aluminosa]MBP2356067.1 hypothetical protein [Kribbella aluminosa]
MNRLVRVLIGIPVAATLIAAGTASVASATNGVPSGPPPSGDNVWCVSVTGAKACFAAYGDRVWVKDTKANGHPVAATIQDQESSGSWYRECFNDRGEAGGWVMCDFDVPEFNAGLLWAVDEPWIGAQASTKINTTGWI